MEVGCGDQYRPVANPIIGPGGQPQTAHFAYVLSNNPIGPSSTTKIDVSGDSNIEVQTVGVAAQYESFLAGNTGALFTANSGSDSVSAFGTFTRNSPVTNINAPSGSKPVVVTSTKTGFMYVLNSAPNASCPNTGSISVIDTTPLVVISTVCVGVNPIAMAQLPAGGKIYAINQGDNSISVYNPAGNTISSTIGSAQGLGLNPVSVTPSLDGAYVFVVAKGDGVNPGGINIITTSNDAIAASVALGQGPTFSTLDSHLNRLYVANTVSNSVSVFDTSNVNLANNPAIPKLATVNVGSGPVGITALSDGTKFYTANSISNDVTVVSATSFNVLKTVAVGQTPVWIAADPGGTKVYAANRNSGTVSIIQTSNDTVVTAMPMQKQDPNCQSSCALQEPVMILTY